jgi:phosphoadenosine phosphosulfate reductase
VSLTTDQIFNLNSRFENAAPQEILRWAIEHFEDGAALSSSFGGESAALIHMAIQIKPDIPVLFLDTGFLFKETHDFKNALKARFHLNVREFRATPEQIRVTAENLRANAEKCCDDAKVDLMKRSLENVTCWIAGLRRHQAKTRKNISVVEKYEGNLLKVHPLANWTSKDLYNYMVKNDLPFHPLWEKGYTSIGCEPCTRTPQDAADGRSGRWAGKEKVECGIHTFLEKTK